MALYMKSPLVLIFSAADGTCGAGMIADCRAVSAAGGIPAAIATGITAQNLDGVKHFWHVPSAQVRAQFAALQGGAFAACKIGVCGISAAAIAEMLPRGVQTVWDPVLSPTAGVPFANRRRMRQMLRRLLPRTDIITPNYRELIALSGCISADEGARFLLDGGARMVLITGIGGGEKMHHLLYGRDGKPLWRAECRRRDGDYHGSGCLFSATLAARIACGDSPSAAAEYAHRATLRAIKSAIRIPSLGGQRLLMASPAEE